GRRALHRDQGGGGDDYAFGQAHQHIPIFNWAPAPLAIQLHHRRCRRPEHDGESNVAACEWIKKNYPGGARYILSGNMDTDKKHSRINMLVTRGKLVVAEAIVKNDILKSLM